MGRPPHIRIRRGRYGLLSSAQVLNRLAQGGRHATSHSFPEASAAHDLTGEHHDHVNTAAGKNRDRSTGLDRQGPGNTVLRVGGPSAAAPWRCGRRSVHAGRRHCLREHGAIGTCCSCREPAIGGCRAAAGHRQQPCSRDTCGCAGAAGVAAGSGIRVRRAALRHPAGCHDLSGSRIQQR
jgi:hypothetical protein